MSQTLLFPAAFPKARAPLVVLRTPRSDGSTRACGDDATIRIAAPIVAARRETSVARTMTALVANFRSMLDAARTRRDLASLDDQLLKDIGVSRADAQAEAARWPWDLSTDHRR